MNDHAKIVELQRLLAQALEVADGLDLTMAAIHIDEALNLIATAHTPIPH